MPKCTNDGQTVLVPVNGGTMGKAVSSASMSLDGFVADRHDHPGPLFDWYDRGDIEVFSASEDVSFLFTQESTDYWHAWVSSLGAILVGRVLFDLTDGWRGRHPLGVPVVVVTHEKPTDWANWGENFHFVTGGVEEGMQLAQQIAGDAVVGVAAGTVASQCLALGLLDEVAIDLVPVVLGGGRPYFLDLKGVWVLGDPTTVVLAERVTHLVFPVLHASAPPAGVVAESV